MKPSSTPAEEMPRESIPSRHWFSSPRESSLVVSLALALGTILLYQPILHNGFINFDDPNYVTDNPHVRQGLSWANLHWAFTTTYATNWHPLTWIAHMATVQFFGLNPMGHHLVSLFLHALNVVLLFLLLRSATGKLLRSAVVAALFAIFPMNVESVAWVSELKSLLSTMFLFAALFAYGWYVHKRCIGRYLAVVVLFALGLMAKPMVITFPFMLLLIDFWPLKRMQDATVEPSFARRFGHLVAEKIPFFLLSAGSAAITLYAARRGGSLSTLALRPMGLRIENAIWSYLAYLGKAIWPAHLAILYPFPTHLLPAWKVSVAAIILTAITGLAWYFRERWPYLLAGWLWYLGVLVPVIGIAQVGGQSMADRYAYVPFLGLFVLLVWLVADGMASWRSRTAVTTAIALAVLISCSWVSRVQMHYWRNSVTLFSHAINVTTKNGIAEDNLGLAQLAEGDQVSGMRHLEAAVRYLPEFPTAHFDLGTLLQKQGQTDKARRQYELTLKYTGDPREAARAHNNIAAIYLQRGQQAAALLQYDLALTLDPNQAFSLLGRGTIEYKQGNLNAATSDFYKAAKLLRSPITYFMLGNALQAKGEFKAAAEAYRSVLQLDPAASAARNRLNTVLKKIPR